MAKLRWIVLPPCVRHVANGGRKSDFPSTWMKFETSCTSRCFTGNHNDPVVSLFPIFGLKLSMCCKMYIQRVRLFTFYRYLYMQTKDWKLNFLPHVEEKVRFSFCACHSFHIQCHNAVWKSLEFVVSVSQVWISVGKYLLFFPSFLLSSHPPIFTFFLAHICTYTFLVLPSFIQFFSFYPFYIVYYYSFPHYFTLFKNEHK